MSEEKAADGAGAVAGDATSASTSGQPRSLIAALLHWAKVQPDKTLFTYLDDAGKETRSLTYKDVEERTRRFAQHIRTNTSVGLGVSPGDRVLLVYPPSLDFIIAYLSCLRAGVIAVPVYPPDPRRLKKNMFMFASIQNSSGARVALTSKQYNWAKRAKGIQEVFSRSKAEWPDISWVVTDGLELNADTPTAAAEVIDQANPADVAFLQYTSGSTAEPKGVMVTHSNLAHNLATIIYALRAVDDTVVVSWLPQYHDMGLIGSHLGTLYCGGSGAYMSPISFIKSPPTWIASVSKYKGTHLQAPNFAYKLTARKFAAQSRLKLADLDLSSVRHIFNAAEPIDPEIARQFIETFSEAGLSAEAMSPGFGLAEHTVYVSDGGKTVLHVDKAQLETDRVVKVLRSHGVTEADAGDAAKAVPESAFTSCGAVASNKDIDIRIVDETSCAQLDEDRVGEIWIDSPSKAAGYWGLTEKTESDFHGRIAPNEAGDGGADATGDDGDGSAGHSATLASSSDGYLRTGDLGFLHGGELFVCGRIKDLIIVRGRNHYPQDIEKTAERDNRIRPGCSAAIDVTHHGAEVLVIAAELRDAKEPDTQTILEGIITAVSAEHGVAPHEVLLLQPRSINKTTSGKIARQWVKKSYIKGELKVVAKSDAKTASKAAAGAGAAGSAKGAASGDGDGGAGEEKASDVHVVVERDPAAIAKAKGMTDAELAEAIADEIARLLEMDPEDVPRDKPLVEMGMDSMALTQLNGVMEHRYGLMFNDEEMFLESATVTWMVSKRGRTEKPPPSAEAEGEDGAPAVRAAPVAAGAKQPFCPWCPPWCHC